MPLVTFSRGAFSYPFPPGLFSMPLFRDKSLDRDFLVYVEPYNYKVYKRRRFAISLNDLYMYVGQKNANTVILKASRMKTESRSFRFRTFGLIEVYYK